MKGNEKTAKIANVESHFWLSNQIRETQECIHDQRQEHLIEHCHPRIILTLVRVYHFHHHYLTKHSKHKSEKLEN
jgi:hypothetical protein